MWIIFLRSFIEFVWRRKRQPTPVFMPGKSHGPRSLVGYNPWGRKESDTTEQRVCVCVCVCVCVYWIHYNTAFVFCFGFLALRHVGLLRPKQGLTLRPPHWRQSLNHGSSRDVPRADLKNPCCAGRHLRPHKVLESRRDHPIVQMRELQHRDTASFLWSHCWEVGGGRTRLNWQPTTGFSRQEYWSISSSRGPCFVKTLHYAPSLFDGPAWHGS